jgi:hypothetical protein
VLLTDLSVFTVGIEPVGSPAAVALALVEATRSRREQPVLVAAVADQLDAPVHLTDCVLVVPVEDTCDTDQARVRPVDGDRGSVSSVQLVS